MVAAMGAAPAGAQVDQCAPPGVNSASALPTNLAAAAQQARASAVPAASARPDDARTASHVRWAESEAMLQRFRDDLRAELRRVDAVDGVPQLTVDTLRTVLESARTAVRATLR